MKTILLLLACIAFSAVGCDGDPDAHGLARGLYDIPKIEVSEHSTDLTCYSGGIRIYKGSSIGKIRMTSPGTYQIKDRLDGKEKFVSGDCVAIIQK